MLNCPRAVAVVFKAIVYFTLVFTFALVTGVIRTLFVAPRIGAMAAVGIEVPIILVVSWVVASRLLQNCPLTLGHRVGMGAIAFALLMISEAALSVVLRGESVAHWAATLVTPVGLLGLAGQVGFALIPIFVGRVPAAPVNSD